MTSILHWLKFWWRNTVYTDTVWHSFISISRDRNIRQMSYMYRSTPEIENLRLHSIFIFPIIKHLILASDSNGSLQPLGNWAFLVNIFVCSSVCIQCQNSSTDQDQILCGTSHDPREGLCMLRITKSSIQKFLILVKF